MYDIVIHMGERRFFKDMRLIPAKQNSESASVSPTNTPPPNPDTPKRRWLPGRFVDRINSLTNREN